MGGSDVPAMRIVVISAREVKGGYSLLTYVK
jgi:hypothetical protein